MITLLIAAMLAAAPAGEPQAVMPPPARRQELLFEAAKLGRTDMIAVLAKAGVDMNALDSRGFTPLILAAYNDHLDTVEALIAAGADACLPDRDQGNTAQMGVAFKGNDAIAARLLKAGCDVNARSKAGQTALMMAALFARTTQIAMLLAAGADRTVLDAAGRSAAAVAAAQGSEATVRQLTR